MKRAVRFLPEALEDLIETQRWYASREPGLGQAFAEAIAAAVERIAQDPATFPCVHGAVRRLVVRRSPTPSTSGRWAMKSWCLPFMDARIHGAGKVAADWRQSGAWQIQPPCTRVLSEPVARAVPLVAPAWRRPIEGSGRCRSGLQIDACAVLRDASRMRPRGTDRKRRPPLAAPSDHASARVFLLTP